MMNRPILAAILVAAFVLPVITGCQQAPVTGRRQLILVSASQEASLGAQAYTDVLKQSKVNTDPQLNAMLQRVGQRIANAAQEPSFQWEFKLIDSDQVNAFCLPGGKVAVYTGILPIMQNEAGMAAVIGHEVAHAMAHHGAERMSQGMLAEMIGEGVKLGTGSMTPAAQAGIMAAFGLGTNVGVLLPFSRKQETEADDIGVRLMAQAGYDPREAVALWKRMASQEGGGKGMEFLSTHPATQNRIQDLEAQLPTAEKLYQKAPGQYGAGADLPVGNIPIPSGTPRTVKSGKRLKK